MADKPDSSTCAEPANGPKMVQTTLKSWVKPKPEPAQCLLDQVPLLKWSLSTPTIELTKEHYLRFSQLPKVTPILFVGPRRKHHVVDWETGDRREVWAQVVFIPSAHTGGWLILPSTFYNKLAWFRSVYNTRLKESQVIGIEYFGMRRSGSGYWYHWYEIIFLTRSETIERI